MDTTSTRSHPAASAPPILVWFRNDLRLDDHPALAAAAASGRPVIPVYVLPATETQDWPPGAASRWWLHHSLQSLNRELRNLDSQLILCTDDPATALGKLAASTGAAAVHWNRAYEPAQCAEELRVAAELERSGIGARVFSGSVLFEPDLILNRTGGPYQVFTPYWKACLASANPETPLDRPIRLRAPTRWPVSESVEAAGLLPRIDWAAGLRRAWRVGEPAASDRLQNFLEHGLADYVTARDLPDRQGCSQLSPHLHFGEISPRRVWQAVRAAAAEKSGLEEAGAAFLRELGWREFAVYMLRHFPFTTDQPLRSEFAHFPWLNDATQLRAWQRGQTGYPLVDAGMRQLWTTGWMHNRVRMVVASFLVKDLLQPWQAGARWFWDTLVDADLANNTLGWQWSAGCGADAAPYFRIFNPVTQSEKWDPDGHYIRRWVPELAGLEKAWIHRPWAAPPATLRAAGIDLGTTYPHPLVEHGIARERALAAFQQLKR